MPARRTSRGRRPAMVLLGVLLPLLVQCGALPAARQSARPLPPPGAPPAATAASAGVTLVAAPALQALLDPYPAPQGPSWLGGDVATSVRIADDRWV